MGGSGLCSPHASPVRRRRQVEWRPRRGGGEGPAPLGPAVVSGCCPAAWRRAAGRGRRGSAALTDVLPPGRRPGLACAQGPRPLPRRPGTARLGACCLPQPPLPAGARASRLPPDSAPSPDSHPRRWLPAAPQGLSLSYAERHRPHSPGRGAGRGQALQMPLAVGSAPTARTPNPLPRGFKAKPAS